MEPYSLGEVEGRFAELVWSHAPLPTKMLITLCQQRLGWKRQSERYVERSFGGSLPGFLAAFTSGKKLSQKEIEEIERIIHGSAGEKP